MEITEANEMVNNQQSQQTFDNMKKAVQGEREDELFYDYQFTLNSNKNVEAANEGMTNTQTASEGTAVNSNMNTSTSSTTTGTMRQDTANFTSDEWVKYITPLVNRALAEAKDGINPEHLYQEFILAGVLVGLGKKPQEAIEQVEAEKTGTSKLLAMSKMSRYFDYCD